MPRRLNELAAIAKREPLEFALLRDLKFHCSGFGYALGGVEDFNSDQIAISVVIKDDARLTFIALGNGTGL